MRHLAIFALLLASIGCQQTAPVENGTPDSAPLALTGTIALPDSAVVESTDRAVFEDLYRRWQASGVADYTFAYEVMCFCLERGPFTVTVEGGAIQQIEPEAPDYRHLTLDSLYARVADAYAQDAALVRFQYAPAQNLLAGFWIDYSEQMADEEFGARVHQVTVSE